MLRRDRKFKALNDGRMTYVIRSSADESSLKSFHFKKGETYSYNKDVKDRQFKEIVKSNLKNKTFELI